MKRLGVIVLAWVLAGPLAAAERRDGAHDFDFEMGRWKTRVARLGHPLSGANDWVESDGETVIRPVWGGRGNVVEIVTDAPTGRRQTMALRLYDPVAREWNLFFASSRGGGLSVPATGVFTNGRGAFYDQERIGERTVQVRLVIERTSPTSVRTEQAFSDDGGVTWETNMRTDAVKVSD